MIPHHWIIGPWFQWFTQWRIAVIPRLAGRPVDPSNEHGRGLRGDRVVVAKPGRLGCTEVFTLEIYQGNVVQQV